MLHQDCISIESIPGKGRGVIAKTKLEKGCIVIAEEAYAFVVSDGYTAYNCSGCGIYLGDSTTYNLAQGDINKYCSVECISNEYSCKLEEMKLRHSIQSLNIEGNMDSLNLIAKIAVKISHEHPISSSPLLPLQGRYDRSTLQCNSSTMKLTILVYIG